MIANALLDIVEGRHKTKLTHLKLQKVLYFAHCNYLFEHSEPLILGHFEAWTYGPVNLPTYDAFKCAGHNEIDFRAKRYDINTGEFCDIDKLVEPNALDCLVAVARWAKNLTAGELVELSHAPQGPWHFVVKNAERSVALGMRITNEIIVARSKNQKIILGSVARDQRLGDILEDAPFT